MPKKSNVTRVIRKSVHDLRAPTRQDLDRLHAAMGGTIDTGDIRERQKFVRLKRDSKGRLPTRKSVIRDAVALEMRQRGWTAYRLWKLAREHYAGLSQSAVHEFLKGQRELELPSIEALMAAARLQVVTTSKSKRRPIDPPARNRATVRAG